MDSLRKFASGLSTVENYARDVYIKSNLTIELDKVVNQMIDETRANIGQKCNSYDPKSNRIFEIPSVTLFCDIIEAIFLHGLKEKLSTTLSVSNVFASKPPRPKNLFCLDFWPIIKLLSHNEQSKQLETLVNVSTDIGRCRAWLRLSLNECLLRSYLESLICDQSSLNSLYRSSAYLRDSQHTEMMRNLLSELDIYTFDLIVDSAALNCWSTNTLNFLGITLHNEDSFMVATALDAIHLISDNKNIDTQNIILKDHKEESIKNVESPDQKPNSTRLVGVEPESWVHKSVVESNIPSISNEDIKIEDSEIKTNNNDADIESQNDECDVLENNKQDLYQVAGTNSLSVKSGWSTQPTTFEEDSYNALLESYSNRAILSSTPDINDIKNSISIQMNNSADVLLGSSVSDSDFEIIPKNMIANENDADNQKFLEQISHLSHEFGLDEQDYKCHLCGRPIGMIYGKCTLCHIDGHLYCLECHGGEESIVPAQIIYNWSFKKYPVCKQNKARLMVIENEPIFDLKILSPNLYTAIAEMVEILDLRTQLFYLHAYLFTCQEHIALKMRKLVWPREHLFEHIHLYSINDLQQVYNNVLATTLRQVITFARKHIAGCNLCKLKGFYCEICKNSEILFPFDTDSTRRCERCKSVFHVKCYEEKYDKHNCPKCLRIAKKKQNTTTSSSAIYF